MDDAIICLENLFLGLGDKTRLRLLSLMAAEPVSVGYLVENTGESQPKVSRHLAYLRNAGLVETRRDGKSIYYGIARQENAECDAVLRAVMTELGAGDAAALAPSAAQPPREEPLRMSSQESEYEEELSHFSDDRREQLDVFLL